MATNNVGIDWMGSLGVGMVDFEAPLSTVPEQHQGSSPGMNQYDQMDRANTSATLKVCFMNIGYVYVTKFLCLFTSEKSKNGTIKE
ncbi:hypothetical protein NQ314_012357 [Rhamnusium bicolor]|uniref:Uncharacterized protein n=1 Tax=Rhamnusium bicolor TaxID=1586634 RepID=A0AAV8XDG5_9CUCU|nr:hypothetical protein NQ314_012357 [Rhamnusium bicolor]